MTTRIEHGLANQDLGMHRKNNQMGFCYWLTGLPGAGKTSIAVRTVNDLRELGYQVCILDGDDLRRGLNTNLGFSRADRAESVRRIGEVARLMVDAGLIVFVSAISPYRTDRDAALRRVGHGRCFEVFIDTDLRVCVTRDPKGLYARAKAGELKGLTGWDDPYEIPLAPEIAIRTESVSIDEAMLQLEAHYFSMTIETQ
jgi:adenylyl-sulfate kinase